MDKKVVAAIIASCVIALLFMNSYALVQVEDEEESSMAQVTFKLQDSQSFSVSCEIADEPEERSRGLMDREDLDGDKGMLFVYEIPQNMSFWMKNTLIPLDIIFIHENMSVINIEEAHVESPETPDADLTRYRSLSPAKWVVEINRGISAERGIYRGTPVEIDFQ